MQYRSMEQMAGEADIFTMPGLSRRDRLERWAEALARQPAQLRAILEIEYGARLRTGRAPCRSLAPYGGLRRSAAARRGAARRHDR